MRVKLSQFDPMTLTAPTWRPSLSPPPWHAVTTSTAFRRSVRIHTRPWSTGMSSNSGSGDRGFDSPLLPLLALLALLALLSVRLGEAGGASGRLFWRRHRQRRADRRHHHLQPPRRPRARGNHAPDAHADTHRLQGHLTCSSTAAVASDERAHGWPSCSRARRRRFRHRHRHVHRSSA